MGVEEYNRLIESLSEIRRSEEEIEKTIGQMKFLEEEKIPELELMKERENERLSVMIEYQNSKEKASENIDEYSHRLDALSTEYSIRQTERDSLTREIHQRLEQINKRKRRAWLYAAIFLLPAALVIWTVSPTEWGIGAAVSILFYGGILTYYLNYKLFKRMYPEYMEDIRSKNYQLMDLIRLKGEIELARKVHSEALSVYSDEWSEEAISERDVAISEQRGIIPRIDIEIKSVSSIIAEMWIKLTADTESIEEIMKSIEHLIPPTD